MPDFTEAEVMRVARKIYDLEKSGRHITAWADKMAQLAEPEMSEEKLRGILEEIHIRVLAHAI